MRMLIEELEMRLSSLESELDEVKRNLDMVWDIFPPL